VTFQRSDIGPASHFLQMHLLTFCWPLLTLMKYWVTLDDILKIKSGSITRFPAIDLWWPHVTYSGLGWHISGHRSRFSSVNSVGPIVSDIGPFKDLTLTHGQFDLIQSWKTFLSEMRLVHTYLVSEHEGDRLSGSVRTAHKNKCYEDKKIIIKTYNDKNKRIHHLLVNPRNYSLE
jgi:hypothetical protein